MNPAFILVSPPDPQPSIPIIEDPALPAGDYYLLDLNCLPAVSFDISNVEVAKTDTTVDLHHQDEVDMTDRHDRLQDDLRQLIDADCALAEIRAMLDGYRKWLPEGAEQQRPETDAEVIHRLLEHVPMKSGMPTHAARTVANTWTLRLARCGLEFVVSLKHVVGRADLQIPVSDLLGQGVRSVSRFCDAVRAQEQLWADQLPDGEDVGDILV